MGGSGGAVLQVTGLHTSCRAALQSVRGCAQGPEQDKIFPKVGAGVTAAESPTGAPGSSLTCTTSVRYQGQGDAFILFH